MTAVQTSARVALSGGKAAHLARVRRTERKVGPVLKRGLAGLAADIPKATWVQAAATGIVPADIMRAVQRRLLELGEQLVQLLLLGTLQEGFAFAIAEAGPGDLARRGIGELIRGLEGEALHAIRLQVKLIADAGISDDAVRVIGQATGLTQQQLRSVATVRDAALRKALADGVAPYAAIYRAERAAQQVHDRLLDYRSRLIARTESTRLTNEVIHARGEELQAAGAHVEHQWLSVRGDEATCRICRANDDGKPRPLQLPFESGHYAPPAHPGCRCLEEILVEER